MGIFDFLKKIIKTDNVEEIVISDLPVISPRQRAKRKIGKPGPKPLEKWIRDIRKNWGDLDDVYMLGRSRLASLPEVQALATKGLRSKATGTGVMSMAMVLSAAGAQFLFGTRHSASRASRPLAMAVTAFVTRVAWSASARRASA